MTIPEIELMTWDWKEYVDIEKLARLVEKVSEGRVHIYEVDTQSDMFAIYISPAVLSAELVQNMWKDRFDE